MAYGRWPRLIYGTPSLGILGVVLEQAIAYQFVSAYNPKSYLPKRSTAFIHLHSPDHFTTVFCVRAASRSRELRRCLITLSLVLHELLVSSNIPH
jgi:hypothetical protein